MKQISRQLVAWVLLPDENEGQDKHVESVLVPCLDAGSNPAISTRSATRSHRMAPCAIKATRASALPTTHATLVCVGGPDTPQPPKIGGVEEIP